MLRALHSSPALYVLQGLKRTIWCESLNMLYLSLAERSLLGCPDASIVWRRQWLPSKALSLPVLCLREEERLSSRRGSLCSPSESRSYHHELADLKYFHSKASQRFCKADLNGQLQGWAGETVMVGRVGAVLTVWVNPSSDTDHLGDLGQAT